MQGKTYKLTHPDYRTLIVLQSGEALATRRDGGAHRVFKSQDIAEKFLGEKAQSWETGRSRHSDDNWTSEVKFDGAALENIRRTSIKVYGPETNPEPDQPPSSQQPTA